MSTNTPRWIRGYPNIASKIGLPVGTVRRLGKAGVLPVVQLSERITIASDERLEQYVAEMRSRGNGKD